MSSGPEPPFLIIRAATAFWVERKPVSECTATLQAFRDGCFENAVCYDRTGGEWPIQDARVRQPPTLRSRLFPWTRIPVVLRLGARREVPAPEIVSRLADVLRSGSSFCDSLDRPPDEVLALYRQAESPDEIIRIAELV